MRFIIIFWAFPAVSSAAAILLAAPGFSVMINVYFSKCCKPHFCIETCFALKKVYDKTARLVCSEQACQQLEFAVQ